MIPINLTIESFVKDEDANWGYHYRIILHANGTHSVVGESVHEYHGANAAIDGGIDALADAFRKLLSYDA